MRIYKTVRIAEHQRALAFRDGNLLGVLTPGTYRYFKRLRHLSIELGSANSIELVHPNLRYLVREHREKLAAHLKIVEVSENQVGLLRINGVATRLLAPGCVHAYWSHANRVEAELVNHIDAVELPAEWLRAIELAGSEFQATSLGPLALVVQIRQGHEALMLRDSEVLRTLASGRYAFWKIGHSIEVLDVDLRVQELELNGQEILTKDRVSLRLNAAVQYTLVQAQRALVEVPDVRALAYRAVQFALRQAVGAVTLDELLADKSALGEQLFADVLKQFAELGLQAKRVGIKDVILPGEMKAILNQVVEAEKRSEANAARRRDEAADVRALANTARMLEGNPMMARLKELAVLESITDRVDTLHVMNGLDGVLNRLLPEKRPDA